MDLQVPEKSQPGRSVQGDFFERHRCAAGSAPIVQAMSPEQLVSTVIQADTPIVLWPPQGKSHVAWWDLARKLPARGFRVESDLLPTERRFTTSTDNVHGTLFDGGDGRMVLLLAAEKADAAKVTLSLPGAKVVNAQGASVALQDGKFDAGSFTASQVKLFEISAPKETGK
jgi:hypothetical protein